MKDLKPEVCSEISDLIDIYNNHAQEYIKDKNIQIPRTAQQCCYEMQSYVAIIDNVEVPIMLGSCWDSKPQALHGISDSTTVYGPLQHSYPRGAFIINGEFHVISSVLIKVRRAVEKHSAILSIGRVTMKDHQLLVGKQPLNINLNSIMKFTRYPQIALNLNLGDDIIPDHDFQLLAEMLEIYHGFREEYPIHEHLYTACLIMLDANTARIAGLWLK